MKKIKFVLNAELDDFWFNPIRPNGLKLRLSNAGIIYVSLRSKTPEDEHFIARSRVEAKLTCIEHVSVDMFRFMTKLKDGHFCPFGTSRTQLPRVVRGETKIFEDGKIADGYSPRLSVCPEEVETLVLEAKTKLKSALNRVLGLLSWQQNPRLEWTLDREALYWGSPKSKMFYATPLEYQEPITMDVMGGLIWNEAEERLLSQNWKVQNLAEPLGHELLREARALESNSLRSCLIMTAAALEVGVKSHCSILAPDTSWLFEKIQSPPVYRIIKEYLPKLSRESDIDENIWIELKKLSKVAEKLFELRNKVAHTGVEVSSADVKRFIPMVSDILYILDVIRGHEWATKNVSPKIGTKMGWSHSGKSQKITISLSE